MGLTLCQQDALHNDALLSQRLHACLLVKREGENNRAHASGFEFVVGTAQPYRRLTVKALHCSLARAKQLSHLKNIAITSEASYRGSNA